MYKLVEGFFTPTMRTDRVVLEANLNYWDKRRGPRLKRIIYDHTLSQKDAVELVKNSEGQVDLVTNLRPLDTLRVAQSPFAKVVKNRGSLLSVFGQFNMRKTSSPWTDIRLRQAVNFAVNRADLIRYAAKGNGEIIPALLPKGAFGYDPNLAPYPFDTARARALLRQAGYPDGLTLTLIASDNLEVQATVVSKMLEQVGLTVVLKLLNPIAFNHQVLLDTSMQPSEQRSWDIALRASEDFGNFPVYTYQYFALDGPHDWLVEQPELQHLYEQALGTVDRQRQKVLFQQMERHTSEQAYFLFLYSPIQLYAVNKAVTFVPFVTTVLSFTETSVTAQHWSVRKQRSARD